jgi:hypothetical protein
MKTFLKIFLVMHMSAKTFAQTQAFAICSISGILESKFHIIYHDTNLRSTQSVADTITLAEAASIFALNAIGRDTNRVMYKFPVKDFEMFIEDGNDTLPLKSKSDMLTDEMKNALKKIHSGTIINFENIRVIFKDGSYAAVSMIKYIAM